jgi:hypothetical protein
MLGKVLISVLLLAGALATYIQSRPGPFRVSRSLSMLAPPAAIFPLVNDFHRWREWSPWDKFDVNMSRSYDGPDQGVGAVYRWSGNSQVGEGTTTIVASQPHERIAIRLQFVRPFKCDNPVEFTFRPKGEETMVTWTMTGTYNFMTKAIGLMMNMDKMSGDQFTAGLTNLKRIVEQAPT